MCGSPIRSGMTGVGYMQVIADLQIHSKYSRAVSPQMVIPQIWQWAKSKGIGLVATGDWTHPLWMREIKANLIEDGSGLLKLKAQMSNVKNGNESINDKWNENEGKKCDGPLFLLATEVSSIYSQGGKLRRIHNLIWSPSFESADKINKALISRGANLISDGRPIVGLTSIEIAELVFSIDPSCLLIPAHIWTPWFSLYGSESGFDSIDECFGQFAKYIYAIETGLSSSPAMNWRIKELDTRSILSFSDAHSGPKLGREATVFNLREFSYSAIREAIVGKSAQSTNNPINTLPAGRQAIRTNPSTPLRTSIPMNVTMKQCNNETMNHIAYTLEFYPEEGKYHYTGHRNCQVKQDPSETVKRGTICPVCGKKLTIGVMHRVEQLAGRKEEELRIKNKELRNTEVKTIYSEIFPDRPPYVMLVPLQEILAEAIGGAPTSQTVQNEYKKLIDAFGSEFKVLLNVHTAELEKVSGSRVAEAISKVRSGDIVVDPGYDGVFGVVKIWHEEKDKVAEGVKDQLSMF